MLATLKEVRRRLAERMQVPSAEVPALEEQASTFRAQINRLVEALASTDDRPEPIVQAVAQRQQRLSELEARIRAAKAAPDVIQLELRRIEAEVKKRPANLGQALDRNPEEARAVIRAIFDGPLRFTPVDAPEGRRFQIEGKAVIGSMLAFEPSDAQANPATSPTWSAPAAATSLNARNPDAHVRVTNSASPAGFEPAYQG